MGYTHYLYRPMVIESFLYQTIKDNMKKVIGALPPIYPGDYYKGKPLVIKGGDGRSAYEPDKESDKFWFNGDAAEGLDHETFAFDRKMSFVSQDQETTIYGSKLYRDFVKTSRKPYDLAVCTCLLVAKWYLPEIILYSDGLATEQSWPYAFELARKCCGIRFINSYAVLSQEKPKPKKAWTGEDLPLEVRCLLVDMKLSNEAKNRITDYLLIPSEKTWEDAHALVVGGRSLWYWVRQFDNTFPDSKGINDPWPQVPETKTVIKALQYLLMEGVKYGSEANT